tara:strand:- start:326 stop:511 length:186 start_codon:yes stop_codon:yes gene_type:complete
MQFQKKTSIHNSRGITKILIKVSIIFIFLSVSFFLFSKIDFPAPYKKIEKIIPNAKLKTIK